MQNKLSFIISIFIIIPIFTFAQKVDQQQKKKIDSLNYLLKNKNSDTSRVNNLNELAAIYIEKAMFAEAMILVKESKTISEKINFENGKINSYSIIGDVLKNQGQVDHGIDYLYKALKITKSKRNLTQESYVYDQLGLAYWTKGDTLSSLENHRKSLQLREKVNNTFRQAQSNGNIAMIYSAQGKLKEAIAYYKASLKFYNQINEPSRSAWSAGNIGLMNYWLGNTDDALKYYIISLDKYTEGQENDGIIWISGQISMVYKSISDFENALKYAEKVHQIYLKTGDEIGIAEAFALKANIYFEMKDFQKAMKTFEESFKVFAQNGDSLGIMNSLLSLGEVYFQLKKYDISLENIQKALKIAEKSNQVRAVAKCKMILGALYTVKGKSNTARKWLTEALTVFNSTGSTSNLPFTYLYLYKVDSLDGNFSAALENHQHYIYYRDKQLSTTTDTEKVAMRYEFEKKEAIAASELKNKQTERNAAIFGLILTTILTVVLIYFFRLRNKKISIEKEKILLQKRDIDRMRETEQFKSRFLTNITHEFRTPLTFIKAHLEVLKENGREEDKARFQEMDNNGSRLLQLISQLLDLSKMESGAYKLKYRAGNIINESIALVQSFQSLADQKEIALILRNELNKELNSNQFVYSQEALAVIISNLLSNAFKYTPKNGTITIDLNFTDSETLTLQVTDSGIGISEDYLPFIFERFYQVDQPTQRTFEGSGIGLALVKELAMIHGGDVAVLSPKDQGCIFTVTLKSAINQVDKEMVPSSESIQSQSNNSPQDELEEENEIPLILVVEDKMELRRFIIENLGSEYRYAEAENGKIAIEVAEKLMPDLIISDVMMPELDGLEMCGYLKNNRATSHIPLILLTAKADEIDKLIGLETGANDYLTKPFSLAEIRLRVKNMLHLRTALHKNYEGNQIPRPDNANVLNKKDTEFLEIMNQTIQANLSSQLFGATELSEQMFLSVSQFNRKIKSITGITTANYIRNYKLQRAVEMLMEGRQVAETAWEIGFGDPVYFSKVFKKHFGYPPSEVKK